MKTKMMMSIAFLGVLVSANAMASVKCFLHVQGKEPIALAPYDANNDVVLTATTGSIQAFAILSLDSEDVITNLQIRDSARGLKVMAGDFDLSKKPASLMFDTDKEGITLSCQK
jgi:hypothetical protein